MLMTHDTWMAQRLQALTATETFCCCCTTFCHYFADGFGGVSAVTHRTTLMSEPTSVLTQRAILIVTMSYSPCAITMQAEADQLRTDLEASREARAADAETRHQLVADLSTQRRQVD